MNKHFKNSKEVESSHIVQALLLNLQNICSPPFNTYNATIICQFGKGMGKIWGVWCKGVHVQ
jgi:hypothetical protein